MLEHAGTIATIAVVIVNIGTVVIGVLLAQSNSRLEIAIAHTEKSLNAAIIESRKETDEKLDQQYREFGETAAAIRQKVNEVELFCRDTFLRRDSFYETNRVNNDTLSNLADRLETRLERMETKINHRA